MHESVMYLKIKTEGSLRNDIKLTETHTHKHKT